MSEMTAGAATPSEPSEPSESLARVESGQKLVIWAIVLNFAGGGAKLLVGDWAALLLLASLVMSIVGIWRLGGGLGHGTAARLGLMLLMLVPIVNLITLLILSFRATSALRAAGYEVGLLGARPKS